MAPSRASSIAVGAIPRLRSRRLGGGRCRLADVACGGSARAACRTRSAKVGVMSVSGLRRRARVSLRRMTTSSSCCPALMTLSMYRLTRSVPTGFFPRLVGEARSSRGSPQARVEPDPVARTRLASMARRPAFATWCVHAAMNQRSSGAEERSVRLVRCGVGPPTSEHLSDNATIQVVRTQRHLEVPGSRAHRSGSRSAYRGTEPRNGRLSHTWSGWSVRELTRGNGSAAVVTSRTRRRERVEPAGGPR